MGIQKYEVPPGKELEDMYTTSSVRDMAQHYRVTTTTIYKWLKTRNISIRDHSDYGWAGVRKNN